MAKRCVLEQKLLFTAYRKSYMRNRLKSKWEMRNQNEWPWPLFRGRIEVMSTIVLHSTLNISRKPSEIEAWFQKTTVGNSIWAIKWSRYRWCVPKGAVMQCGRLSWRQLGYTCFQVGMGQTDARPDRVQRFMGHARPYNNGMFIQVTSCQPTQPEN